MGTVEQVVEVLRQNPGLAKATAGSVDENMAALKTLYTASHGAVGLDSLDWHWIATTLKNKGNQETPHDEDTPSARTTADALQSDDASATSARSGEIISGSSAGAAGAAASFGPLR